MKHEPSQRTSHAEAIEATAAAWLAELDDELPPEKAAEFARWRAADPRHEAALARLETAWTTLQSLRDFRPEARRHPDRDLLRPGGRRTRHMAVFPTAAAMALAASLVIAAGWWFGFGSRGLEPAQSYATTVDGYQRITLPDGSLLEMNANTTASVRFTKSERRVELRSGEAHFTVAKNPERPFWVEAGAVAVRAVGTAFNVRRESEQVEVLVTEGRVQIASNVGLTPAAGSLRSEYDNRDGRPADSTPASGRPTTLVANQRAVVSAAVAVPAIEQLDSAAIREALAWQGPRLVFLDTPLAEVVDQFNRRNEVKIVLGDEELRALPVGGSFRAEYLDAFIRLLASDKDIVVERPDAGHIILRKAK